MKDKANVVFQRKVIMLAPVRATTGNGRLRC
jgi:hypothetical protein